MAINNHERVGKAMEILKHGLASFMDREFKNLYKDQALSEATRYLGDDRQLSKKGISEWDAAGLLKLMWEAWNEVFRRTLGHAERSLVSELRDLRNKWAHQESFSTTTPIVRLTRPVGSSQPFLHLSRLKSKR
jgi:Swt1-like HEPN